MAAYRPAFALGPDLDSFWIRIQIQRKICGETPQFRNSMKQLLIIPSPAKKERGISMTIVLRTKSIRLDPIAEDILLQFERINLDDTRVQPPDVLPVSYNEVTRPFLIQSSHIRLLIRPLLTSTRNRLLLAVKASQRACSQSLDSGMMYHLLPSKIRCRQYPHHMRPNYQLGGGEI